jgi:hypothetical protein
MVIQQNNCRQRDYFVPHRYLVGKHGCCCKVPKKTERCFLSIHFSPLNSIGSFPGPGSSQFANDHVRLFD